MLKPWEKVISEEHPLYPKLRNNPSFKMDPVSYTEAQQHPSFPPPKDKKEPEITDLDQFDAEKMVTPLGDVPNLPAIQLNVFLDAGYETVASILTAPDEELLGIKGIGEKTVTNFKKILTEFAAKQ
jgi:hypothetical protein